MKPSIRPLPTGLEHCEQLGPRRRGALRLFVGRRVLDQILEYSERNSDREFAGFLLGGWHRTEPAAAASGPAAPSASPSNSAGATDSTRSGIEFVEVRGFLPAHHTRNRASSVTFTYETWTRLRQDLERRPPDDQLIGWHHTHPGLGIFLSEFDRFIHRYFFGQHWQVALVVDPRQKQLGFFQWSDGRLAGSGFTCVDDGAAAADPPWRASRGPTAER